MDKTTALLALDAAFDCCRPFFPPEVQSILEDTLFRTHVYEEVIRKYPSWADYKDAQVKSLEVAAAHFKARKSSQQY